MERIFFFHNNFPVHIQNDSLLYFFMPCQYFQNNEWKKISKFEREDKSNGNPLVHHGFFFFFHKNFPMNIQKDSLLFFFMPRQYFYHSECKKISKFDREDKSNGNPLVHHAIFIFLHKNFPLNMKNDSLLFFFYIPVRISIIMNAHT